MVFEVSGNSIDKISADCILLFAFEGKDSFLTTEGFSACDKLLNGLLSETAKFENFKGKNDQMIDIHTHRKILSPKVCIAGLGRKDEFNGNELRQTIASFAKTVSKKISSVALLTLHPNDFKIDIFLQAQVIIEGFLLGSYRFNRYKKEKNGEKDLETIILSEQNKNVSLKIKEGIKQGKLYSIATRVARDLVNESAAVVTPSFLAKFAQDLAKKNPDVKCTVFDKSELEKMGMNAFLGVAKASDIPPKFIYLEYSPKANYKGRKVAIVGKGITFDTGGVNVKPGDNMQTMKLDMAGAAAVLGLFSVIPQIKPQFSVSGLIAATPNLISGNSILPGDVVKALNGKTIEVLNTDAEGRVTMADSLSYAVKKGASEIIDLATLTGACEVALGTDIAGLFSNNKDLTAKIEKAADKAGEKVWELPLEKDYKELNKSEAADISNIPSTRYGGAITAALFLKEFVEEKPWVHLDIAGPAYADKSHATGPKGGTGFGVRTLLNFLKEN